MSLPFLRGSGPDAPGTVTLLTGPMFSGKTSELVRSIEVAQHANVRCFLVRPLADTRWPDAARRTHANHELDVANGMTILKVAQLPEAADAIRASVGDKTGCLVAIDEAQFLGDLRKGVEMLMQQKAHVVIAALDGDFNQEPFPGISSIYPICDTVTKLSAVCGKCKRRNGLFTVLLPEAKADAEASCAGGRCVIGGADKYQAVCRACLGPGS